LVYASAYLRRHHRAAFTAALLNSQPRGFYSPSTLVQDARLHGVPILPIDIHKSSWDCSLERLKSSDPRREGPPPLALRLGFRLIRGLRREVAESVERVRAEAPLLGVVDLMLRGRLHRSSLLRLGASGAFRSMGLGRRESLWGIQGLPVLASPLLAPTLEMDDPWEGLPPLTECDELLEEYATTGVSVESHPMALIREALSRENFPSAKETRGLPTGKHVEVAGMVITRQRPSTASGVLFVTLEDETGHLNVIVWPKVYERFKQVARDEVMLVVRGKIERQGPVVHLIAQHLRALRALESPAGVRQRNFR
jgi:error-prone DNA polymerase